MSTSCSVILDYLNSQPRNTLWKDRAKAPAEIVRTALVTLTHGSRESTEIVRCLDPAYILATAWNPKRLVEARELLAAGNKAPPINVTACCLDAGPTFYLVTDGMHRTIAHLEAGLKIKAKISRGSWLVQPSAFMLWKNRLWHKVDDTTWEEARTGPVIDEDVRRMITTLGAEDRDGLLQRYGRYVRRLFNRSEFYVRTKRIQRRA